MKTVLLALIALLLGGILTLQVVSRQQDRAQEQRDREMAVCASQEHRVFEICLVVDYGWDIMDAPAR